MDDRFDARIRAYHQEVMSNVMGRLQQGETFRLTPQEYVALSDLAGALNYWRAQVPETPVDVQPVIAAGDFARKLFAGSPDIVTAFPFHAPAAGYVYMSAAEFQGDPWLRRVSISTIAGDMDGPVASQGKQATVSFTVGVEFPAGALLFCNHRLIEAATPGTTGSGFSIIWPAP